MPGGFTDYLENKLLDHVFRNSAYTAPSQLYISLYTTAPTDTTSGTEVSHASYSRVACVPASTFDVAASGATQNSTGIIFPVATGNWGTVVAFGIMNNSTGGNLLAYGPLLTSKNIQSGDVASFGIGDLDITLD